MNLTNSKIIKFSERWFKIITAFVINYTIMIIRVEWYFNDLTHWYSTFLIATKI